MLMTTPVNPFDLSLVSSVYCDEEQGKPFFYFNPYPPMFSLTNNAFVGPDAENHEEIVDVEKEEEDNLDQPMDLTVGRDEAEWREMESFAAAVKRRRLELGLTQGDVGAALGRMGGGGDLSQTTISRFEALNLSRRNMAKLRPLLQDWLDGANSRSSPSREGRVEGASSSAALARRGRRRRTSIDGHSRARWEAVFALEPRPPPSAAAELAYELGLEREVVRVWFCNRRQKEKRTTLPPSPAVAAAAAAAAATLEEEEEHLRDGSSTLTK